MDIYPNTNNIKNSFNVINNNISNNTSNLNLLTNHTSYNFNINDHNKNINININNNPIFPLETFNNSQSDNFNSAINTLPENLKYKYSNPKKIEKIVNIKKENNFLCTENNNIIICDNHKKKENYHNQMDFIFKQKIMKNKISNNVNNSNLLNYTNSLGEIIINNSNSSIKNNVDNININSYNLTKKESKNFVIFIFIGDLNLFKLRNNNNFETFPNEKESLFITSKDDKNDLNYK